MDGEIDAMEETMFKTPARLCRASIAVSAMLAAALNGSAFAQK